MWPERGLKLESLSDALSIAVAVLAVECEKHVCNVYVATYKTFFRHYIGTLLKAK